MRSNVQALRDRGGPSGPQERLWEGGQCFQGAPGWSRSSPWGPQSRKGTSTVLPPPEVPGSPRYQGAAELRAPNQYSGTKTLVRPAAPGAARLCLRQRLPGPILVAARSAGAPSVGSSFQRSQAKPEPTPSPPPRGSDSRPLSQPAAVHRDEHQDPGK
uniref:Uncharacterized protein n=1 Tax=Rangifer tarandus platyrhynchus TaxID=3082113 RepID=A0ACB0E6B5_RANTA|nr:unnamed protein product [Rangifer tarandus platyrhynchus]